MTYEGNTQSDPQDEILARIGRLTQLLRQSIRDLGLEKAVVEATEAIPDARDRLRYVARMTEQAAVSVLNATEVAQPLQDEMSATAKTLLQQWDSQPGVCRDRALEEQTRNFLSRVSQDSATSSRLLVEIMMAQGFQDLTGQVITKMIDMIGTIERELLKVLADHLRQGPREPEGLLNGPQISTDKRDVVTDQRQVDDLMASLGF